MINNHKGIKMKDFKWESIILTKEDINMLTDFYYEPKTLTLLDVKKMIKPLVWESEVKNEYEARIGYFYFIIKKYDHKDFRLCIRDDFGSRQYASLKEAKAEVNKFLVSTVCTILGVEEND